MLISFAEVDIARHLGTPDLAILPISVGGTLPYVKSWDPTPAGYSIVPDIPEALTSSSHMSPGDAVDMHRLLLGELNPVDKVQVQPGTKNESGPMADPPAQTQNTPFPGRKRLISLGVHFGTFCSGPAESRDTIRTLRKECVDKGVDFVKFEGADSVVGELSEQGSAFVVVDHGGTLEIII